MTKLMTSISVMQCVEKGLLDLDEDISRVLPELKDPDVITGFEEDGKPIMTKANKPVTLR
jgi:CubicO group peptidase (beta-lactamase class C family)